jgi:hypothetical protein
MTWSTERSIGGYELGRTMASQQDDGDSSSSPSLPDDVVAYILACLPAKSVVRLRHLSRSWNATLSSEPFAKLHLRRANDDKPKIFFTPTDCDSDDDYQFYAWQHGCAGVTKLMPNSFSRPAQLTKPLHGLVLVREATASAIHPPARCGLSPTAGRH